ncbi:MAG: hypothetical protein HYU25_07770 [Candidatus Rokubacteria bacterium]|nr:hypothetical protein [Candidatus Rokubacteria bacterium]
MLLSTQRAASSPVEEPAAFKQKLFSEWSLQLRGRPRVACTRNKHPAPRAADTGSAGHAAAA